MLEFARYDARKRLRGTTYLSLALLALAGLVLWIYPSFADSFEEDELLEAYPEALLQLFDVETMASLEGFLAFELYVFGWIILLGLYIAYSGAGLIADDVDRGRMDSILALPVSRARVVAERFLALGLPIVTINLVTPVALYVGAQVIDEPLSAVDLLAVHLLSVPYLFACAGIGLLCSVVFDRVAIAQRVALGVTFGLYLLESLLKNTDYEVVGAVAPMRYYDPNEVLLESSYDLVGAVVLVGMTLVLVIVSQVVFTRSDV